MSKKIINEFALLSDEEQQHISNLVGLLLQVRNIYTYNLILPSFRKNLASTDASLGILLSRIYEKKYCTRKELKQRAKKYDFGSNKLIIETCAPQAIPQEIYEKAYQVDASDQIGLYAQRGNTIYKRTLSTDLKKMLA